MKLRSTMAFLIAFGVTGSAAAFDCPNRFKSAEASIDAATKAMEGMSDENQKKQVHMLIDDAKMLLHGAIHNHEKPQHKLDHARSMAKADSAKAYADAAAVLATK
ncbi:MAG: hypothetical protein R3174_11725 [Gammaproteobacteria bacterium]|nr:hypothetical protein [Gammaproteobacteria bacterium]